ncbi:hypothetical protein [Frigoribacterium sp. PhB118]|uniref:hypothetical protein n=1 Tax=Frigoribacterium sp. PhB118 TaxID=2485175 RepID=UPI000F48E4AE|nr:hypothetical protein [Frigoribacterium sp. PhB118]ROS52452.1 hypothetical protein EDF21_2327 [Frigoribacterium sp. PhB118]
MFRLVAALWWFALVFHSGIAFFIMVAGSQGAVPAAVVWESWGTLVARFFVRRIVLRRWLYRIRFQRARYWQSVNRDAAARN